MKKFMRRVLWGLALTLSLMACGLIGILLDRYNITIGGYHRPRVYHQPVPDTFGAMDLFGYGTIGLLLFGGWTAINYIGARAVRHQRRPIDGSLPVFRHWTVSGILYVNLDELDGASYRVRFWRGDIVVLGQSERQREISEQQTLVRIEQASHVSDSAYSGYLQRAQTPRSGTRGSQRRGNAHTGTPRQPQRMLPEPEPTTYSVVETEKLLPAPPRQPDIEILSDSEVNKICFALDENTGEKVYLDLYAVAHLKILCASRQGKTNLVRSILLAARQHYDIIIIDPKNSWGAWADSARLIDGRDTTNVLSIMGELNEKNNQRSQLRELYEQENGTHCRSIYELPTGMRNIRPIILVMDELGRQIADAREEEFHTQYLMEAQRLLPTSATQGIHAIGLSQTRSGEYSKYLAPLLKNSATISGLVHDQADSKGVGYRGAHTLNPYQFHYRGQIIKAPLVDTMERRLLTGPVMKSPDPSASQVVSMPKYQMDPNDTEGSYRKNVREWMRANNGRNFGGRAAVPIMIEELAQAGYPITRSQAYVWFNRRIMEVKHGREWEQLDERIKRSARGT